LAWNAFASTLRVAGEEPSSQEAARAERGTRAKSLRAEAQAGLSCHVAIASSLWKRTAYPVEISAEQNFGEGQAFLVNSRVCPAGPKQSANRIEPRCPHWGVVSLQQLRFLKPK